MKKLSFIICCLISSAALSQEALPPPTPVIPKAKPPVESPAPAPIEPVVQQSVAPVAATPAADESGAPSFYRPEPISFNVRAGAGSSFGPQALWFSGAVEVQLDKFIALGPVVQYGTNSSTDFFLGSFGPRFTIPMSYFELGFNAGFGFAYRNTAGFEFTNFLYQAGANLDFYIIKNLSVGVGYQADFLSAQAEQFISALTGSVTGHF